MKTLKNIVFCILLVTACSASAQSGFMQATDMDVNGIFIGGKYTKSQVTTKWGTPTKYWSGQSEFGLDEEYEYSNNLFRFSDSGIFVSFFIRTSNFVVYTSKSGGIKVGDPISRISAIGLGTPFLQNDGSYGVANGDNRFIFRHSNNRITEISFISPI